MDLIGVIVALASEGAVFRRAWGIKSLEQKGPFRCYGDEERMLVISGVGKVKCAAAVAWLLARYPDIQKGVLINAGAAGNPAHKIGSVSLIHQAVDGVTGKRFYPDILFSHPYGEATLHTVDRPVVSPVEEMAETDLIDMEGAAFLQTAQLWMSCHRTHLVKVVSDNLNPDRIDGNTITDLMENTLPAVEHIIEAIPREPGDMEERMEVFAEIGVQWRLTASQRAQLDRAGRAWLLRHPNGVFASPDNVEVSRDKQMRNQWLKVLLDRLWEG
jgi:hypothetical protein